MTAVFPLFSKPFPGSDNYDGNALDPFWDALDAWCDQHGRPTLSQHIAVNWDEDEEELTELAPEDGEWFPPELLIETLEAMQKDASLLNSLDQSAQEEIQALMEIMQAAQAHGAQWRFFIDI